MTSLVKQEIMAFEMSRDHYDFFMIELDRFDQPMTKILTEFLQKRYGSDYWYVVDISGDERIDAYVLAGKEILDDQWVVHIYSIAVRRDFEGQGWGLKLMKHLLTSVSEDDEITALMLEVRQNNERAIDFYNEFGFKQVRIEKDYYDDGLDAIVMRLEVK